MRTNIKRISITALFSALILVTTAYVKIPLVLGYIHIGDIFIMLGCYFLPMPFCLISAALGASLADLVAGYVPYMPITAFAKILLAVFCRIALRREKVKIWEMIIYPLIGSLLMVVSYLIFEGFYYGWAASIANLPMQFIQPAISIPVYIIGVYSFMKIPYLVSSRRELAVSLTKNKRKKEKIETNVDTGSEDKNKNF